MNIRNNLKAKRYLVTGASGFIGRAVCARLLDLGATVHGASRRNVAFDSDSWTHSCADLSNAEEVDRLVGESKPEFVIHLASTVTGMRDIQWVRKMLADNLVSAVNVLVAAQNHGVVKSILAGSLEEPGVGETEVIAASPYAASKWSASMYARTMHALYGLRVAVARIFMVYGPGQLDLKKFVPYVCISAAKSARPKIMSGERLVDWIFLDDVVEGLIRMTLFGPDNGAYVDLGSGRLTSTGEVANEICKIAGTGVTPQIGSIPDRQMEQIRVADTTTTQSVLDWSASTDLKTGLKQSYAWYSRLAFDE
jgi:UDP-glucose 4-epimerase